MEKEFVPYEQSLALKELGFDEPCCANMFDYSKSHINTDVPNRIRFYNVEFSKDFNQQYEPVHLISTDIFVSIPLYQQAFRWLLILVNKNKHFSNKWTISYNEDYYSLFLGGCNMGVFKAELECLKKLIEIVKNK